MVWNENETDTLFGDNLRLKIDLDFKFESNNSKNTKIILADLIINSFKAFRVKINRKFLFFLVEFGDKILNLGVN